MPFPVWLKPVPTTESLVYPALPEPGCIHCWWLPYQRGQARTPLLGLLARYLQVAPETIVLEYGAQGRPRLAGPLAGRLDFNWSHSGQHAAIAVACGVQVGIDIESRRRRPRMLELARRYFAPAESDALELLDPQRQETAFWALWTGKEAVLKATGSGISHGLHRISFLPRLNNCPLDTVDGRPATDWQLRRPELDPGYSTAIAWQGAPAEVTIYRMDE